MEEYKGSFINNPKLLSPECIDVFESTNLPDPNLL